MALCHTYNCFVPSASTVQGCKIFAAGVLIKALIDLSLFEAVNSAFNRTQCACCINVPHLVAGEGFLIFHFCRKAPHWVAGEWGLIHRLASRQEHTTHKVKHGEVVVAANEGHMLTWLSTIGQGLPHGHCFPSCQHLAIGGLQLVATAHDKVRAHTRVQLKGCCWVIRVNIKSCVAQWCLPSCNESLSLIYSNCALQGANTRVSLGICCQVICVEWVVVPPVIASVLPDSTMPLSISGIVQSTHMPALLQCPENRPTARARTERPVVAWANGVF